MYNYSRRSKEKLEQAHPYLEKLEQAHPYLQLLFNKAIEYYDISIMCSVRDEETQNAYFRKGLSELEYPNGKHNKTPSMAIDFTVWHKGNGYSYNEEDTNLVAGFIEGLAVAYGIKIRIGARWDNQWVSQNGFKDFGHIELVGE